MSERRTVRFYGGPLAGRAFQVSVPLPPYHYAVGMPKPRYAESVSEPKPAVPDPIYRYVYRLVGNVYICENEVHDAGEP